MKLDPMTLDFYYNGKRIKATDTPKSLGMNKGDIIRVVEKKLSLEAEDTQKSNDTDVLFPSDAEDNDGDVEEADVDDDNNNNNKENERNSKSLSLLSVRLSIYTGMFIEISTV